MDKELPSNVGEDKLSKETLVSSLPSHKNSMGSTLYKYQGCWYHPMILPGVLDFQTNFKSQATDIVLASFPKSGTTWLKALTIALFERLKNRPSDNDDDHPLLSHNPHALVPFLEVGSELKSSQSLSSSSSSSSSHRLFSTHMPLHTLQEGLTDSPCKIVYICRNMKDVMVSHWHFLNSNKEMEWSNNTNGKENCTLEAMFESMCSGIIGCGPFWENVLSYWKGSLEDPKHVLFMRYEELKVEPHGQIKRLAEFLDCPFTMEEENSGIVDKILQLCSLSNLSSLEINKNGKTPSGIGCNTFFRKGEVGDSKNHLTPEMEKIIDMIIEEKLQRSGLKF